MATQMNPFQSSDSTVCTQTTQPLVADPPPVKNNPIDFTCGLGRNEYSTVERLVISPKHVAIKLTWLVIVAITLAAIVFDSVIQGEMDYLLEHGFILLALLAIAGIYDWQRKRHAGELDKMAENQVGIFAPVKGQFRDDGLTFWANGKLPVDYVWKDFVGYRHHTDVLILYLDFPNQLNILSASRFGEPDVWQQVVSTVKANVPAIGKRAKVAPRETSQLQRLQKVAGSQLEAGEWAESANGWEEVLAINPNYVPALVGLANCMVATGRNTEAKEYAERAIELGTHDTATLFLRANLLAEQDDFPAAIQDLNRIIDQGDGDAEVFRSRGLCRLKSSQLELALEDTDQAIQLDADDPISWNNRGVILLELGRVDEATEALSRSTKLDPSFERPQEHLDKIGSQLAD